MLRRLLFIHKPVILYLGLLLICSFPLEALAEDEGQPEDKIPLYLLDELGSGSASSKIDLNDTSGMWIVKQRFALNTEQDEDTIIGDSIWVEINGDFPTESEITAQASKMDGYEYIGYEVIGDNNPLVILTYVPSDMPEDEKQFAAELTEAANTAENAFSQTSSTVIQEYDDTGEAGMTQEELNMLNDIEEGFSRLSAGDLGFNSNSLLQEQEALVSNDDSFLLTEPDGDDQEIMSETLPVEENRAVSSGDVDAWQSASNIIAEVLVSLFVLAVVMALLLGRLT